MLLFFGNAVCRANIGALPAVNADRLITRCLKVISSAYADIIGADGFAVSAFNALKLQTLDGRIIRLDGNADIRKLVFAHSCLLLNLL